MKKAYFAISKSNRIHFDEEIEVVHKCMAQKDIELQVFVDQYTFPPAQNKEMMQAAFAAIDECEWVIAEVSEKAIGVGIEVGYAVAKGKQVIYIHRSDTATSTTIKGCARVEIEYANSGQLHQKFSQWVFANIPKYLLGDEVHGGIIISVDAAGEHGLITVNHRLHIGSSSWHDIPEKLADPTNYPTGAKKYTDWRLPTYKEMGILRDNYFEALYLDQGRAWREYTYWSSEKHGDDRILCVTMGTGGTAVRRMNELARIQPVRNF